ncbi:MAG: acyltransferase [Candidatus ainarchaeum sp.]|nr:acyltransferase [Candidatus ainarchaeum sp.]
MGFLRLISIGFEKAFGRINFFGLVLSSLFNGTFISPFARIAFYGNISIGKNCRIASGCIFRVPKTARLVIGNNCDFREYAQVLCREGQTTEFGDNCLVQPFSFVSDNAKIGSNVILSPHSVVVAATHNFDSIETPILKQGSDTLPIEIGDNVWIGTHAIILGPSKIGSDSIIGAGTIVKGDIPEKSIVKGERKLTIIKRR